MWKEILYVGVGSFVGGALRYAASLLLKYNGGFPWATFIVNLTGCLIIGILWAICSKIPNISPNLSLLLSVGFCGGLTTFSTFSKESLILLQNAQYGLVAIYILASILVGIACVAAGYYMVKG